ncbi:MAG: hypothetical protein EBY98_04800 [Acidimicrobiia bacterium]|nr:hypothetical protein [Acidimicrobiia bacterium]
MHFLFEIEGFNALDHLTPVASELLRRGNSVTFVQIGTWSIENDPRTEFLRRFSAFETTSLEQITTPRQRWIFKRLSQIFFGKLKKAFMDDGLRLKLLECCSGVLGVFRFTDFRIPDVAISGWGDPNSFLMVYGRRNGAKLVSLPHGYPCLKNSDFNPQIREIIRNTGRSPDFSLRNHFDVYVVATERNRRLLLTWSIAPDVVEVWGNARFCPEWLQSLHLIVPPHRTKQDDDTRQKVLVFLPAATSGFKLRLVHSLIDRLAMENINIVLKPHTREGQDLGELLPTQLLGRENVTVVVESESSSLMRWADTVVNFATGTAIEGLIIGKRVIFTRYLTANRLSWEDCAGVAIADSEDDVINYLRDQSWRSDPAATEPYLRQEIYADGRVSEPLTHYAERLELLASI